MDSRAYKRLVNNIVVQSLKPVYGNKPLGKLMLASNTLKKINYARLMMKTTE